MNAVLSAPPPGVLMRPFRILPPLFDAFAVFDRVTEIDEVICVGPLLDGHEQSQCIQRDFVPHHLARTKRIYACRDEVGGYVMIWRVACGRPRKTGNWDAPPRKLAHWDALEIGAAMILCPAPDVDTVEKAVDRAAYMRHNERGWFQPFYDGSGSLWVARLPHAP